MHLSILATCLLAALGLSAAPSYARPLKATNLRVTSTAFDFGCLTLACDLRGVEEPAVGPDSGRGPTAMTAGLRYRFRVSNRATQSAWESDWLPVPSLHSLQEPFVVSAAIQVAPDSQAAPRIRELTVEMLLEQGGVCSRTRKRTYFRWNDGCFRALQEDHAKLLMSRPRAPLEPPVRDLSSPAPSMVLAGHDVVITASPRQSSWGALKVKYRGMRETMANAVGQTP